eukprot:CAMPEP_0197830360 /NCGR_PEP_ID=MMETSP1437-20131217/6969_1 /TAXON_ID=49252 ORGANISM="Eucampia antarctica, Strain CCMP1452" /NCGR_SAMPLE_ID=MMETSP1437 /ASSEMBLY_ACC=CAM_ASM_001096 /LENGTH=464 /DNA_ID=CAMNT_0043432711 /DNA_START=161 /DNA_END=1551 /DNA_ORIENTATION=-
MRGSRVRSSSRFGGIIHHHSSLAFVVTRPAPETCCSLSNRQAEDLSLGRDDFVQKGIPAEAAGDDKERQGRRRRVSRKGGSKDDTTDSETAETTGVSASTSSVSGGTKRAVRRTSRRVVVKSNPYKLPLEKEEQWMFFYDMLCEHNVKYNRTVVAIPAGPAVHQSLLRNWCADQRKSYMKTLGVLDIGQRANWGTYYLTGQKKQLLDQAGFYWGHFNHTMDDDYVFSDEFQNVVRAKYKDWLWNPFYDKIVAYQQRHNHTRVPHNYTDQLLAAWTAQQRLLHQHYYQTQQHPLSTNINNDNNNTMSQSENQLFMPQRRLKKLDDINFEWGWKDLNSKYHDLNITMLTTVSDNFFSGDKDTPEYDIMLPFDALVLENLDRNDPFFPPSLGIIDINAHLKKKKNINVVPWAQRVRQLKEYRKQHGHCDVPLDYKKMEGLGTWVKKQQSNRKLSPRSRYQLQKLGFT